MYQKRTTENAYKTLGLKNFTVFDNFQLDVVAGINVFVGENGTGKTKAVYATCEISQDPRVGASLLKLCFKTRTSV